MYDAHSKRGDGTDKNHLCGVTEEIRIMDLGLPHLRDYGFDHIICSPSVQSNDSQMRVVSEQTDQHFTRSSDFKRSHC